jgi:hypothetical protein
VGGWERTNERTNEREVIYHIDGNAHTHTRTQLRSKKLKMVVHVTVSFMDVVQEGMTGDPQDHYTSGIYVHTL